MAPRCYRFFVSATGLESFSEGQQSFPKYILSVVVVRASCQRLQHGLSDEYHFSSPRLEANWFFKLPFLIWGEVGAKINGWKN